MSKHLESALAALQAEYAEACKPRDAVNAINAPLEVDLAAVSAEIAVLREKEDAISRAIDANRGSGEEWLAMKKRIGALANSIMEIKRQLKRGA